MADTRWKVVAEKLLELLQLPAWSSSGVEQAHGSASAIRRCHPNETAAGLFWRSFLAPLASSAPPASRSGSKRSDDKQMTEQDKKIEESSEPDADPEMPALTE